MRQTKLFITTIISLFLLKGTAQTVQGSIQQGTEINTVNVVYLPDHTSAPGEYVNYLGVSIAIPLASSAGVTPTIAGVGIFAPLTFLQASPFSYTQGNEKIFSWFCANGTPLTMSWTNAVSFTGAKITITGGSGASKVRLIDFTNLGGGPNGATNFNVGVNVPPFDLTNYANIFYSIGGGNGSTTGLYANTDQFVETNLLIALPVNLVSFSGYKSGSKNILQWRTENELNNLGFEVQRSNNGLDFSSIGFVNAKSGNANSYSLVDNYPTGTHQYYRLKQVDYTNTSKLSNIILIKSMETITGITINKIFPNPARESINISFDAAEQGRAIFIFYNVAGKIVYKRYADIIAGSNTLALSISILPHGAYWLAIKSGNNETKNKIQFIKQ